MSFLPLGGAFKAKRDDKHYLGAMQTLPGPMRTFDQDEIVDYAVIGVGSAGGVLLQRLARAGFRVVGLEAGPFWDTERDWVSDEKGSRELYWNDLRDYRRKESARSWFQQQWQGCGRRVGPLGQFYPALSSVGF